MRTRHLIVGSFRGALLRRIRSGTRGIYEGKYLLKYNSDIGGCYPASAASVRGMGVSELPTVNHFERRYLFHNSHFLDSVSVRPN